MKNRIAGRKWSFQVFQHNQNKRFITLGQNKQKSTCQKTGWWEFVFSPTSLKTTHRNLDKLILSFPTPRSFAMLPNLRSEGALPEGPHQLQVEENLQLIKARHGTLDESTSGKVDVSDDGTMAPVFDCFWQQHLELLDHSINRTNTKILIHFPELRMLCLFHFIPN